MATTTESEVIVLAKRMATQEKYEDAWTIGLEIQAYDTESLEAFAFVLDHGTLAARRATAFWLSDEAEVSPPHLFLNIAQDPDDDIRFYAAYGLGYMPTPEAVQHLRHMLLNDPSDEVRHTAVHSLYAAAMLNHMLDTIIQDFAQALKQDLASVVREEIVISLSYFLGSSAETEAIALLETLLTDSDPKIADQARISLSVLKNEHWQDEHALN